MAPEFLFGLTRLLDFPSFTSFSAEETTRLVLGNPPPQILHKDLQRWIQEAAPLCCKFAYALRTHITSLQPAVVDKSSNHDDVTSSDNHDDFSLIIPPRAPGFRPVSIPPTTTMNHSWLVWRSCMFPADNQAGWHTEYP